MSIITAVWAKDDSGLDYNSIRRDGEKWLDSRFILRVEMNLLMNWVLSLRKRNQE